MILSNVVFTQTQSQPLTQRNHIQSQRKDMKRRKLSELCGLCDTNTQIARCKYMKFAPFVYVRQLKMFILSKNLVHIMGPCRVLCVESWRDGAAAHRQTAAMCRGALEEGARSRGGPSGGITSGVTPDSALIQSHLQENSEFIF